MSKCTITKGAMDWQVFQRNENNVADIELEGKWECEANHAITVRQVQIRVVRESTSNPVNSNVNWQDAKTNSDGTWNIILKNVPTGGLYRIESSLKYIILGDIVHAVCVGDLWVITGQSNSAGYGRGEIEDIPELGVHILKNEEKWSLAMHPLNENTRSNHPNFEGGPQHSPYLVFGKRIKHETGIPVGLIQASLGGSALSMWNPGEADPFLYKNMVHCIRLSGGKIKGILWYQGCSDVDVNLSKTYLERFQNFVVTTRAELNIPNLEFITVQLNRYTAETPDRMYLWSVIREVQRQASHKIKNVYVVPAIDLPLTDVVHNSTTGNITLGNKLADCALTEIYKIKRTYKSPEIKSAILSKDCSTITMEFSNVESSLYPVYSNTNNIPDFKVEDESGFIDIKETAVESVNKIKLVLIKPAGNNTRVHCHFGADPKVSLFDVDPLRPLLAFYDFPCNPE